MTQKKLTSWPNFNQFLKNEESSRSAMKFQQTER